ncbi:BTB/POZ domain-containing protein FBL11 isoform X2 [Rhododendron vialii]|uniref:BTB/POZ domain-containing protein FBL11 isoform X2 n=1 Tax=Rhododendron vialii TaxID=182163 RepID=UPI00265D996F|nr:BTB/POZ domain-containing protein FBL11 isoform X2 [Rhododendron vialii]
MASNSDGGDQSAVVLKCTDPHQPEPDSDYSEIEISTAEICSWDFPTILTHQIIVVKASRNRLIEHSSYFRGLLCGRFRESILDCVSIKWNLETFMIVLKFLFGFPVDVTSTNFLPLFEAALFFGVEMLLLKCKAWLIDLSSQEGICSLQQLDNLIHIWRFGVQHANDFIPELCTSYLARNFMWVMNCNSFPCIPWNLLVSCVKHPDLTVDSERHLADSLIAWLASNNEQVERWHNTGDDCSGILKEIRISLLPLWFAAGKRRCCYFSKLAEESIDATLYLMTRPSTSMMNVSGDVDSRHFKIRLTQYTKKVDLSGCPQMNSRILLMSMLPCSYSTDLMLTKVVKQYSISLEWTDGDHCQNSSALLPTLSFEAVEEVDISNCPRLPLEASIECFCKSFPSMKIFKAAHHLNFKMTKLVQLLQKCPLLEEIDLAVDISPVIPSQVSIVSSSPAISLRASTISHEINSYPWPASELYTTIPLLANVTKLTLEGRVDLSDYDLKNISEICASLFYLNLRGCITVTDTGISVLILRCVKLHSLLVCDTSFGHNSALALRSGIPNLNDFLTLHVGKNHAKSLASEFQVLHVGGCRGVDETSLSKLISETPMLKSLCLRETLIVDDTLYSFLGSSLEMLDVSDTKVSSTALAHIVSSNPGLYCLEAKGCRNLFQQKSKMEDGDIPSVQYSCEEWCNELAKTCKLEEIALGWGFSCCSLEALKPAIAALKVVTVGLGASLGQDAVELLPTICPLLEEVILYFQVISDCVLINIMESLRHLQVLALCYCLELLLLGCRLLNSDSQRIISTGWPGLISIHLEDCGEVTRNGVASLFDCKSVEDMLLRHNGPGIQKNFILDAALLMPMLRKLSLDVCDAVEGDFDLPNFADRYFLSIVSIARCKPQRCALDLQKLRRTPVHKETLVLVWDSKNLTRTVIKERV